MNKVEQELFNANSLFISLVDALGKSVIFAWREVDEESVKPGTSEVLPDVCGLTIAIRCNSDEAQTIVDYVLKFEDDRNATP